MYLIKIPVHKFIKIIYKVGIYLSINSMYLMLSFDLVFITYSRFTNTTFDYISLNLLLYLSDISKLITLSTSYLFDKLNLFTTLISIK